MKCAGGRIFERFFLFPFGFLHLALIAFCDRRAEAYTAPCLGWQRNSIYIYNNAITIWIKKIGAGSDYSDYGFRLLALAIPPVCWGGVCRYLLCASRDVFFISCSRKQNATPARLPFARSESADVIPRILFFFPSWFVLLLRSKSALKATTC